MKSIFSLLIAVILFSCVNETAKLDRLIQKGEFSEAIKIIELKLQNDETLSISEANLLKGKLNEMQAVKRAYTLTYAEVFEKLKTKITDLTERDVEKWTNDYSLEYYLIDAEIKYYRLCIFNLFKVNEEAAKRANISNNDTYDASIFPLETITWFDQDSVLSKKINVAFTYFQEVGNLPDKSILRAWIPFVRENKFQSNIKVVHSSIKDITLPEKDYLKSMIYFEKVIDKSHNSDAEWEKYITNPSQAWISPMKRPASTKDPTFVCQFIYEYESKSYYNSIDPNEIKPYNTSDKDFQKYIAETEDRLFTPYLKNLSKEIIGEETNDYLKAKLIYEWICKNIKWTNPKPVMGDRAEYTAKYRRGDCGAKSNLFITLCRLNKIPARSQGGWLIRPDGNHAQHTWAQVYFEPYGWIPVDATMGVRLIHHKDDRLKYFYFGNCTPHHLIIYDDDSSMYPEKEFNCIYGGGSQLGAFEWKGGDVEPNVKISSIVE
jgi:transglutaminase-like putative cysteine protease